MTNLDSILIPELLTNFKFFRFKVIVGGSGFATSSNNSAMGAYSAGPPRLSSPWKRDCD